MAISKKRLFIGFIVTAVILAGCEKRAVKKELDASLRDYKKSQEHIQYLDERSTFTMQK